MAASPWWPLACDVGQALLVAPAEVALAWPGAQPTGRAVIHFFCWEEEIEQLPAELKPKRGKKPTDWILPASSAKEAEQLVERLVEWLLAARPEAGKPRKGIPSNDPKGKVTTVPVGHLLKLLVTHAEDPIDAALATGKGKHTWTQPVREHTALFWRAMLTKRLYIRADADGLTLADTTAEDRELEDVIATAKPTQHGTWTFDSGVGVAMWAPLTVTDLEGFDKAKQPADLAAAVAKKPLVLATPMTKNAAGAAALAKVAPGTYVAKTGGDRTSRWLRFQRA